MSAMVELVWRMGLMPEMMVNPIKIDRQCEPVWAILDRGSEPCGEDVLTLLVPVEY